VRFYIPPNLQKNFKDLLASDVATPMTLNFDITKIVRVNVPEIDHREKSSTVTKGTKYSYTDTIIPLEIGDYLQDVNGIYLINQLRVERFPNCFKFLLIECNTKFTVKRFQTAVYDNLGNVITAEGNNPIATDIYCSSLQSGAQFATTSGGVGVIPMDTAVIQTRLTAETKNIAIGDNFMWFSQKYIVIFLDYSQISMDGITGMLGFTGKRVVVDVPV